MLFSFLGLCTLVSASTSAETAYRQSLQPYVLYDFVDADENNNMNQATAADKANHPTVNFGPLSLNPRAQWLRGQPGVWLKRETTGTVTSALESANLFNTAWNPLFSSFTIEMWVSKFADVTGDFFSLGQQATSHGTQSPNSVGTCINEPTLLVSNNPPNQALFKVLLNRTTTSCGAYTGQYFSPSFITGTSSRTPSAIFFRFSSFPSNPGSLELKLWQNGVEVSPTGADVSVSSGVAKLLDSLAKLRFANQNSNLGFEYALHSFAIYPTMLDDATIQQLYTKGLPNVKPYLQSFKRAVEETTGGVIQLCPNLGSGTADSDCLDYANKFSSPTDFLTLTPSNQLEVFITSLPGVGSLYDGSTRIQAVPTKLTNNNVNYVGPPGLTSWSANYTTSAGYYWQKDDLTNFTYMSRDPSGANSSTATVTVEVFPKHNTPLAASFAIDTSDSIYAGRKLSPGTLGNAIILQPTVTEFLRPIGGLTCADVPTARMCTANTDEPDMSASYCTILSTPSVGNLFYKSGTNFISVDVNTRIPVDTTSNPQFCISTATCVPSFILYYNVSLSVFTNRSSINLGSFNFTYTFTSLWNNLWNMTQLGNTRYGIDAMGSNASQPVPYQSSATSPVATVNVVIKNGFYAESGASRVKQKRPAIPQMITLKADDLTIPNPTVTARLLTLPAKGQLYESELSSTPITALQPVNLTLAYVPSVTGDGNEYAFGNAYTTFDFVAVSNGVESASAKQTINVDNTNDPVLIEVRPNVAVINYVRVGNPQTWTQMEGNELYINFTDPDTPAGTPDVYGQPLYQVTLKTSDNAFQIFLSDASFVALTPFNAPRGELIGLENGAGTAGAGAFEWRFIANRSTAYAALNPIRLRPNAKGAATLTITIQDGMYFQDLTDPVYQGNDWRGTPVSRVVALNGEFSDTAPTIAGEADQTVLGVIYGVGAFVGLSLLICAYLLIRCLLRRRGGGGSSAPRTGGSGGSKKNVNSKTKKTKSAYLHTVEL